MLITETTHTNKNIICLGFLAAGDKNQTSRTLVKQIMMIQTRLHCQQFSAIKRTCMINAELCTLFSFVLLCELLRLDYN